MPTRRAAGCCGRRFKPILSKPAIRVPAHHVPRDDLPTHEERHRQQVLPGHDEPDVAHRAGLCGGGMARVSGAGPRSEAQNQLTLADRAYLVALGRVEVDQAWRGQRSLACPGTY